MNLEQALNILGLEWPRTNKLACPKTEEKTPSLHLYEHTNSWYCFSCGANGDGYGLIALFTQQPIGSVLHKYGDGKAAEKAEPVVTRNDMLRAVYADWLNFQGEFWRKAGELGLPMSFTERAMYVADDQWGGPLDIGRLGEEVSPAKLATQVAAAKDWMEDCLTKEQEYRGIFGSGFSDEARNLRRPIGGDLRTGSTARDSGAVRVGPPQGDNAEHDGRDQAFTRLLRRRRVLG